MIEVLETLFPSAPDMQRVPMPQVDAEASMLCWEYLLTVAVPPHRPVKYAHRFPVGIAADIDNFMEWVLLLRAMALEACTEELQNRGVSPQELFA